MKAVIITRPGGPEVLRIENRPIPEPGPTQLLVRVHATALNRADLMQRRGNYPAPAGYPPEIPGLEFAGEVESVGSRVARFARGDRVMGIVGGGAQAEYLRLDEGEAVPIPVGMGWTEAAAIPEAFMTAHDALATIAGARKGERVLVHAVGSGVGTAAVQLAKSLGAITFGTSRSPWKLERVADLGLDHPIDASGADWPDRVAGIVGSDGIEVTLDLVGGAYHLPCLRLAAPRGRIVVIGLVGGARTETDLALVLRKRLHVVGTVMRARTLDEKITVARDFATTVVPLFESGRVRPVVDSVFPIDGIQDAHRLLEAGDAFGKVVLTW